MAHTPFTAPSPNHTPRPSSIPTNAEPIVPLAGPPPPPPIFAAFPEYEFLRELGRGGMGVVYLARHRVLDRLEAVKVMLGQGSEERFRQEVRATARLRHPNVVTVYTALTGNGCLAFTMEYVEGETLARLVRVGGPLPAPLACSYVRQAAYGLQHAHEQGMTHRDVKPQNLMLLRANGNEVVKVLDFGLAKLTAVNDGTTVTIDGQALGTPGYVAPEQIRDASAADIRADIYSLGVTLWLLMTGDQPATGAAPDARPSDSERRGWPVGLAAVIARMTAWDPADRYQTPAEVARALEPFAAPAHDPNAPSAARFGRNRKLTWAGLAVLVSAALAVLALTWPSAAPVPRHADDQPSPQLPPVPKGFVSVFNGQDLSGWVVDGGGAEEWQVVDGAIVTSGRRNGPRTWLLSAHDYGDVRVRFEYQLEAGGNSGFAFRAVPGERPVLRGGDAPTPTAYHQQVEIADNTAKEWQWLPTGQIAGGRGKDGPILKPVRPACLQPANEWNAVEIEIVGQSLKMTVNGELVQDASLDQLVAQGSLLPALARSRGRIGFQQMAKTVRFRNVEVLELAPSQGEMP